jgi:hypothetical protein
MRTNLPEGSDRGGYDAADDQQDVARDNPRRRRDPGNEREDDDWNATKTSRSPLRHGVQHE